MPYFCGSQCQRKEYEANVTVAMNARFSDMLQMAYASLVNTPADPLSLAAAFILLGNLEEDMGDLKNTSLPAVQMIHQ
jgi:hypothetical protein